MAFGRSRSLTSRSRSPNKGRSRRNGRRKNRGIRPSSSILGQMLNAQPSKAVQAATNGGR